jgi:flagellar motor switch protein FliG
MANPALIPGGKGTSQLAGSRKAAVLMVALGPDISSEIYRHLSDEEMEQITVEIATLGTVSDEDTREVIEEFYSTALAKQYISQGGIGVAKEMLERALGTDRALEIIERLQGALQVGAFDFVKKVDSLHLLSFIQNEHPQTIALILAHLEYEQAAIVMGSLSPELQADVALRIATMDQTAPEIISEVGRVLERKIATVLSQEFTAVGGVEALAELLNRVDRTTEKGILEALEEENQPLADEVKKLMFTFDDIVLLQDRAIQQVLKEIDQKELAVALKGGSEEVREKVFSNMSARAADFIKEEMEFMGPVRMKSVEEGQQRIVAVVRRLEEAGEIFIARGGEEELVV